MRAVHACDRERDAALVKLGGAGLRGSGYPKLPAESLRCRIQRKIHLSRLNLVPSW